MFVDAGRQRIIEPPAHRRRSEVRVPMVQALEGIYRGGKVELAEVPASAQDGARVVVVFLPDAQAPGDDIDDAEAARHEAIARVIERMRVGYDLGGPPYPRREELYDRGERQR